MQQYRVRYSLGEYANPSNTLSAFNYHSTNTSGLETVVYAANAGQAQRIVESQHGGSMRCRVHFATPVY